jgi:putative nucleotidyltransferase with HDIG domain
MNRKIKTTLQRLPEFVKYLMILGVVVFISFLFPNNVKFKYHFTEGQTWRYDDLKAPFDFPIKKTDAEIAAASAELEKDFSPFYSIDPTIVATEKAQFKLDFEEGLTKVWEDETFGDLFKRKEKYLKFGDAFLDNAYQRGVIDVAPEHLGKEKGFVINIVQGNTTRKKILQNIWTVKKHTDFLKDTLPQTKLKVPEFLLYILTDRITPNLTYNDTLTQLMQKRLQQQIVITKGKVEKGELIATKDGIITKDIYQKLVSFQKKYEEDVSNKSSFYGVFTGYFLLTCLIMMVFIVYVKTYEQDIFAKFNRLMFILLWFIAYSYLVWAIEKSGNLSSYLIPFCIVPIIIKHFYSDRIAFFTHIVNILIVSFLTTLGYEFIELQILAGIVAVLSVTDARNWNGFFSTVFAIGITYALGLLGLSLIKEGTLESIDWGIFSWIFLNMLLTMLAFPLIPLLERVFGFTSSISLVELSDMSRPLLKNLSLKAPGTMQHSLQVANLCEAAAETIKADTLLVKVAALYHDIGKMEHPQYFSENQSGYNPHNEISNIESAKIIIGHVTEGIKLAKKHRLPQILIDFINTHHGTTRVEYFYRKEIEENPEANIDEAQFRYPGVRPKSKEETILMIADSLEASCKSLQNPTGRAIDEMVEKIIAFKIKNRQLEESELTFEELEKCKIIFKSLLRSINHVRMEYPEEQN